MTKNYPFNLNERVLYNDILKQQDNIDALNEEIIESVTFSRNSNDGVYVQLHKENGETITSNELDIDVWETLNLDSLPTNFADGQELMITLLQTADSVAVTDWNTAFGSNPTMSNKNLQLTFRVRLATTDQKGAQLTSIRVDNTAVAGVEMIMESTSFWNGTTGSEVLFQLIPFVFNANMLQEGVGVSIMRSNISQYVESIKRRL